MSNQPYGVSTAPSDTLWTDAVQKGLGWVLETGLGDAFCQQSSYLHAELKMDKLAHRLSTKERSVQRRCNVFTTFPAHTNTHVFEHAKNNFLEM